MIVDIVGGGSLGLLYGGKLAQAKVKVRFWCRQEEQAQELKLYGLEIADKDRTAQCVSPAHFEADTLERMGDKWAEEPGDYILLTTKQKDTLPVCKQYIQHLRAASGDTPGLICFQNGTGHLEAILHILPEWEVYAAITTEGASRISPHEVLHAGSGETWIGRSNIAARQAGLSQAMLKNLANELVLALRQAGFSTHLSNEIDGRIYRKLLINAVINPLTALWRIPNGQLLDSENRIRLMKDLYNEGTAVYDAFGIPWDADLWEEIEEVCRKTAANTSSMLKDVLEGRHTEVRWINGSIAEMAAKAGVSAPGHEMITRLVEGLDVKEERYT